MAWSPGTSARVALMVAIPALLALCAPAMAETGDFLCDTGQSTADTCVIVGTWAVPPTPVLRFAKPNVRVRGALRAAVTGVCSLEPATPCVSDGDCAAPARCARTGGVALEATGTLTVEASREISARGVTVNGDQLGPDAGTVTLGVGTLSLSGIISVEAQGLANVDAGRAGQIVITAATAVTLANASRLDASTARGGCGGGVTITGPATISAAGLITTDGATGGGMLQLTARDRVTVPGTLQASNTSGALADRPACLDRTGGGQIYLQASMVEFTGSARARGAQGAGGTVRLEGERSVILDSTVGVSPISVLGGDANAVTPGGAVFLRATAGDIEIRRGGIDASGVSSGLFGSDAGAFVINASGALRCESSGIPCALATECGPGEACREVGGNVVVAAALTAAGGAGLGNGCAACEIRGTGTVVVSGAIDVAGGRQGGIGGKIAIAAGGDLTVGPAAINASAADGGDVVLTAGERAESGADLGGTLTVRNDTELRAEALLGDGVGGSLGLEGCDVTIQPTAELNVDGGARSEGIDIVAHEGLTIGPLATLTALPDGAITLAYRRDVTLAPDVIVQPSPFLVMDPTLPSCPACGNATVEALEQCDGAGTCPGASEVCLPPGDSAECTCAATCGSVPGIQAGEQCDGTDLGGATCASRGFLGGTLTCTAACVFNESGCTQDLCGDGAVGPSEACDPGGNDGALPAFGDATCASLGFPLGGVLTCTDDCSAIVVGPHCATTVGLACSLDVDCPPGETCVGGCLACGNGFRDAGEECDAGSENRSAPNHCREDCRLPVCGDDTVDFRHCSGDIDAACVSTDDCGAGQTCVAGEQCDQGTAFCVGGTRNGAACCTEADCPEGDCPSDDCSGNRDDVADCCRCDCTMLQSLCGPAVSCDDHNPCTADACDPGLGCLNVPVANSTPCPDADLCNGGETCQGGVCVAGTPPRCFDSNVCTKDACLSATGCTFNAMSYADAIDAVIASRNRAACVADSVPAGVRRALERAESLLRRAADGTATRAAKLRARAEARLRKGDRKASRASGLSDACVSELRAAISEAVQRAGCLR